MSEIWVLFIVVFVATVVIMMVREALGRSNLGRTRSLGGEHAPTSPVPPWPARVLFWTWFVGFFLGMFATEWMATSMLLRQPQDRMYEDRTHSVALLINATWWLVWGLVPVTVIRSRGLQRFNAFKAVVAYSMRHSFRSCVVVWLIGVCVLGGLGAWGLAG